MKHGKKYLEAAKLIDKTQQYEAADAIALVKKSATAKFDETVELHIRTGCDSRHADQQIRGAVVLPNGTGKTVKVLVFAKGTKLDEAQAAGADYVGGEELIPKIQNEGWLDFDVVVATPDMMGVVGYTIALDCYMSGNAARAEEVGPLRVVISEMSDQFKNAHVERLSQGRCTTIQGFVFNDILYSCVRIAEHSLNIAAIAYRFKYEKTTDPATYMHDFKHRSDAASERKYKEFYEKYMGKELPAPVA